MARTPSTMLELGTRAPDFALPATDGNTISLSSLDTSHGLLVAFICNHCPFVIHIREELARFSADYTARGLAIVAINSNDVANYPDDAPDRMAEEKRTQGYVFPYLFDETQAVARAYRAACTPDFYLFDSDLALAYRGQLDGSRPDNGVPVTGADLRAATDAVLAGQKPPTEQRPSLGCNIKWKAGNEPDYF